jgi:hypothetical protein
MFQSDLERRRAKAKQNAQLFKLKCDAIIHAKLGSVISEIGIK